MLGFLGYFLVFVLLFAVHKMYCFGTRSWRKRKLFFPGDEDGAFLLVGGALAVIVSLFFSMFLCDFVYSSTQRILVEEQRLVTLQDRTQLSGKYALISGSVKEGVYYSFYTQSADGGMRHQSLSDSEDIVVYQYASSEDDFPRIGTYRKVRICPSGNEKSVLIRLFVLCFPDDRGRAYDLHVPAGTIQEAFTLDQ